MLDRIDIRGNYIPSGLTAAHNPPHESQTIVSASGHPIPESETKITASGSPIPKSTLAMAENFVSLIKIDAPEGSMPLSTNSFPPSFSDMRKPNEIVSEPITNNEINFFKYFGQKIKQILGRKP